MGEACLKALKEVLQPAAEQGADYLVLGCTHYPFLNQAIHHLFDNQFTLVDSGLAVARQTARILIKMSYYVTKWVRMLHVLNVM